MTTNSSSDPGGTAKASPIQPSTNGADMQSAARATALRGKEFRSPDLSERNHSLPLALLSEADFLTRRFRAFASDLATAAIELQEIRNEVAYLRSGIMQILESGTQNKEGCDKALRELLRNRPGRRVNEKLIG